MEKGISAIVATLLMLIITIALIGTAWTFVSGIFTSKTAQILEFVDFHNGEIIVRNSGTAPIAIANIKVYVSGSPEQEAVIKSDKDPIPPGQIATLTILDAYNYNGRKNIRVITPGSSFLAIGNFGNNYPEGSSTWYAKIGKHTGWGINDCGWNCNDWIDTLPDNSWRWLPNLVAWYRFDEGSGTIANDETTRNDGNLVNGPQWVDGKYGKALSFDGVDDYVEVPDSPSLNPTSITITLWVYQISRNPNDWTFLLSKNGWGSYHIISEDKWASNQVGFTVRVGGIDYRLWTTSAIGPYWSFLAFTYDATTGKQKVYFNGKLENEASRTPGNIDTIAGPLRITGAKSYFFNGIVDEVRIYNRALSEEEIKLLYEQEIGKFSSPASWDASSCPVKVYSGYFVCCMCEDPAHNCAGCEIAGWFKKFVTVPASVSKVWMKFSTDDPIRIYINGQLAYETGCCYNPHSPIELTPYIKKGAENLITVKFYEGCWCGYFGGNIWYDNLIDNGGFEEGTWGNAGDCCCGECSCTSGASCSGITGGSYCACPNAPGGSCQFTATLSTDAKEGKYSLNLTGRNACACNSRGMLTYEIGKTYKLSFWYKHVQGPDCPRYCMWVCGRNVCDPLENLCDAISRDGNWHYYEKTFTVQPGSTCMSLYFYGGDGSDTQFSTNLYDDVRIIEVS
jgi:flagellin-like protein